MSNRQSCSSGSASSADLNRVIDSGLRERIDAAQIMQKNGGKENIQIDRHMLVRRELFGDLIIPLRMRNAPGGMNHALERVVVFLVLSSSVDRNARCR
jgi:hypothetical protein